MHQFDVLPFPIGSTYSQNGTPGSTDGQELEGKMYWVEDLDYTTSPAVPRTFDGATAGEGKYKLVRIVRNVSGIALQPCRLVSYKLTAYSRQVDGYCTTLAQECFPIDEFLPYSVPNNDLFYITLGGYATVYTGLEGSAAQGLSNASTTQIIVCSQTAATSQATTAGRIVAQDLTGATSVLGNQIQNRIGMCLSARTTNQTNTKTLIFVYNDW